MKRVTAAALAAFQLVVVTESACSQSARESDFAAAARAIQQSVAPVMCIRTMQPQLQPAPQLQLAPPGSPGSQHTAGGSPQLQPNLAGTAFFITKRGDFVTAASVIGNFLQGGPFAGCTIMVWFTSPVDPAGHYSTQSFGVALNDCVVDAEVDIARCRTIDDLTKVYAGHFAPDPVTIDDGQPDPGTAVSMSGYLLFDTVPIVWRAAIGGYQPAAPAARQMVIDRPAGPGAAGRPVYDSHGHVLGLIVQVRDLVLTNVSVASTSLVLSQFLKAHPIENK